MRATDERLASLEHDARQPRLAMEEDRSADKKTRERTEGAATAVQAMHGDSFSASRVDSSPKTNSTSFGVKAEPPTFSCRDDVVVENGAAAPKLCLSPLETRTTTAAGGLLLTGETSTATRTASDYSTLWFCQTEETYSERTSTPSAWYDSIFRRNKLLTAPSCRRVIETKSGQIGCSIQAVLKVVSRPSRFWERGARCFVVRLCVLERLVVICNIFWRIDEDSKTCGRKRRTAYAIRIAVNRFSPIRVV